MMKRSKTLHIFFLISWIILLSGTAMAQDTTGKGIEPPVFEKKMKKRKTLVLDVRTSTEYNEGHIPGAINVDLLDSTLFTNWIKGQHKKTTYLLYCRSGKRSGRALVMMQQAGYLKLYHLNGGIAAWKGSLTQKQL
jgi:rhodanese-related sulfurtransferase